MACKLKVVALPVLLPQDYMAETPAWAVYGAEEAGFDPTQQRVKKERRHPGKDEGCA